MPPDGSLSRIRKPSDPNIIQDRNEFDSSKDFKNLGTLIANDKS